MRKNEIEYFRSLVFQFVGFHARDLNHPRATKRTNTATWYFNSISPEALIGPSSCTCLTVPYRNCSRQWINSKNQLKHIKAWLNFCSRPPLKIKLFSFFFLLRPCILILKVSKNFRETFFWGIESIRVELMSRERWRQNDSGQKDKNKTKTKKRAARANLLFAN